jgi:hypothetical protein
VGGQLIGSIVRSYDTNFGPIFRIIVKFVFHTFSPDVGRFVPKLAACKQDFFFAINTFLLDGYFISQ